MLYQLSLVLVAFICTTARAEVTAGALKPEPIDIYDAPTLERMSVEDLMRVQDEFKTLVMKLRGFVARERKLDLPLDVIRQFARFPMAESQRELYELIRAELKRANPKANNGALDTHPDTFLTALETLAEFGSLEPVALDDDLLDLMSDANDRLAEHPFKFTLAAAFTSAREAMIAAARRPLPSLVGLTIRLDEVPGLRARVRIRKLRDFLNRRIKGQPEVVRAAVSLELRSELYGPANRLRPDALYLMGLPGTGKDTTAEALTDALHERDGAHVEHMFPMPNLLVVADLWKIQGSPTGYEGALNIPPLLKFLVEHSGGRYKFEKLVDKEGKPTGQMCVKKNDEWIGATLPGYTDPEKGVIFINEFHNWSKAMKDAVVKQAREKGYFTINNPNGGESQLYVPIRFVFGSNEGIELVTSREANGARHGRPLTYDQLDAKWTAIHDNKTALKNSILSTNGAANGRVDPGAPGISEELVSRIDPRYLLLMRPSSPRALREIAEAKLEAMAAALARGSNLLGPNQITWTPAIPEMLQAYDYEPEEGSRPIESRLKSMIEEPLEHLIEDGVLKQGRRTTKIEIDARINDDHTRSLVLNVTADDDPPYVIDRVIDLTLKDRPAAPLTDEEIDALAGFEDDLKGVVFGLEHIIERVTDRLLSLANGATARSDRPATMVMIDGLSSTGKTQFAKELARVLARRRAGTSGGVEDDDLVTFDCNQIQTMHDFRVQISGLTDRDGNPIPSRFMKEYDRRNGQITIALDEFPNIRDPELRKAFYEFFREPVVTTFSDHKPRRMAGVKGVITGNASEDLYTKVPDDIPVEAQMDAWAQIYRRTVRDEPLQRRTLLRAYSEALLNRVGRNNIFLVPPHTYRSIRQVAQLKLGYALDRIRDAENSRGWDVVFPTARAYSDFVDVVIAEGFSLREQAASIDTFIRDDVEVPIDALLIKNKVPSGARVVVRKLGETPNDDEDEPGYVTFQLLTETHDPIEYRIKRPYVEKPLTPDENILITTSAHEAGHDLVRHVLFPKAFTSTGLYVIPGVTKIGTEWVYYRGLAKHRQDADLSVIREHVVRTIAVLLGGQAAERLITRGESHSAGKANDIKRIARHAQASILEYGLSDRWGLHARADGQSVDAYVAGLPERQKLLLHQETEKLLNEGHALAESVLEANFTNAFVPLTHALAERGRMERTDLTTFYKDRMLIDPLSRGPFARFRDRARTRLRKIKNSRARSARVQLDTTFPRPPKVVDLVELARTRKQNQFDQVALPDRLPVGTNRAYERAARDNPAPGSTGSCQLNLAQAS